MNYLYIPFLEIYGPFGIGSIRPLIACNYRKSLIKINGKGPALPIDLQPSFIVFMPWAEINKDHGVKICHKQRHLPEL